MNANNNSNNTILVLDFELRNDTNYNYQYVPNDKKEPKYLSDGPWSVISYYLYFYL